MKIGFIKLYRESEDNFLYFSEAFTRWQAWQDLLLLTNSQPGSFTSRGVVIKTEKGQLGYSILSLSKRWKWSRGKVLRFLELLKNEHQISYKTNNVTTLITILNWEKYQCETCENLPGQKKKKAPSKTPSEHQTDTNKNNIIKNNNINDQFLSLFIELTGKRVRTVEGKAKSQISARLAEGYTFEDFRAAITNCKNDPWHKQNPKYLTPEFITREDKLQMYLNAGAASTMTEKELWGV